MRPQSPATPWDLPLRLFHWGLVGAVFTALATGLWSPEWWLDVHSLAGYTVGILIAFRLVWGLIGSAFSRFSRFPMGPRRLFRYAMAVARGQTPATEGHNPAGAWMILFLLGLLAVLTITGLTALGGQEGKGPLAAFVPFSVGFDAAALHATAAYALMGFVAVHVLGVLFETRFLGHPVLAAMMPQRAFAGSNGARYGRLGLIALLAIGGGLSALGAALATAETNAWREKLVSAEIHTAMKLEEAQGLIGEQKKNHQKEIRLLKEVLERSREEAEDMTKKLEDMVAEKKSILDLDSNKHPFYYLL